MQIPFNWFIALICLGTVVVIKFIDNDSWVSYVSTIYINGTEFAFWFFDRFIMSLIPSHILSKLSLFSYKIVIVMSKPVAFG